jgi:hypothetical protein
MLPGTLLSEIPPPPGDLDGLIDWFDHVSTGLVSIEEYSLRDIGEAVREFTRAVEAHGSESEPRLMHSPAESGRSIEIRSTLRADHARFAVSVEQLDWFFGIVAREDHGGHRQALGQYGRVFTEALRRHLRDERAFLDARSAADGGDER